MSAWVGYYWTVKSNSKWTITNMAKVRKGYLTVQQLRCSQWWLRRRPSCYTWCGGDLSTFRRIYRLHLQSTVAQERATFQDERATHFDASSATCQSTWCIPEGANLKQKQIYMHSPWRNSPCGPWSPHYGGFRITFRHSKPGRTPLDEVLAHCKDLHLTTHNTHKRQTSMPPAGFEPVIPASELRQTHALDRAASHTRMQLKIMQQLSRFRDH